MALFTDNIFRSREVSPTDTTTRCTGSMEAGEKERAPADLSPPTDDDYFVLRQPKFEIVTPPPWAALPDQVVTSTTAQTARAVPTHSAEAAVRADSDCSSFIVESRETPFPPYLPATTNSRNGFVSKSAPSHDHSESLDSVASSVSSTSGSTLLGSTGRDSLKDGGSMGQN